MVQSQNERKSNVNGYFIYDRIGSWYCPFLPLMAIFKLPIVFYAKKVSLTIIIIIIIFIIFIFIFIMTLNELRKKDASES